MAGSILSYSDFNLNQPQDTKSSSVNRRLKNLVSTYKDITVPSEYRKIDLFWTLVRNYFYKNLATLATLSIEPALIDKKALQLAVTYAADLLSTGSEPQLEEIYDDSGLLIQEEFEKRMAVEIASIRRKKYLESIDSMLYDLETNHLYLLYIIIEEDKFSLLKDALPSIENITKLGKNNFSLLLSAENKGDLHKIIEIIQREVKNYNAGQNEQMQLAVAVGASEINIETDKTIQKSILSAYERARKAKQSRLQQLTILQQQLSENPPTPALREKIFLQYHQTLNACAIDTTSEIKSPKKASNKV